MSNSYSFQLNFAKIYMWLLKLKIMNNMDWYISYLLHTAVNDISGFDHWYMWLILPAMIYTVMLVVKFALLTLPIWLPLALICSFINVKIKRN